MGIFNWGKHGTRGPASGEPWLDRREWSAPIIKSKARSGMWVSWFVALFWNAISLTAAYQVGLEIVQGRAEKAALFVLLFPLVGLALLGRAVYLTVAWKRFGETPLTLDPFPGSIGGQVGGTLDLALPFDPARDFRVVLTCAYSYMSGSGKNRSRRENVIWQSNGYAHTRSWGGKTRLEILFDVDDGLPAADVKRGSSYHLWRLTVGAELPGADFERKFELPVFPTRERSQRLRALSTEHSSAAEDRNRALEDVLNVRQIPGGVELFYPAYRHLGSRLSGVVFGLAFFASGIGAGLAGAPVVFPIVFPLIGGGLAGLFLYKILVSLRVRLDEQWLETEKYLLGRRIGGRKLPRGEVLALSLKKSLTTTSGGEQVEYFKIRALTAGGRPIDIGYNLPGRDVAREALESLSLLTGIPSQSREPKNRQRLAAKG